MNVRQTLILMAAIFWPMQVFSAGPPTISSEIPGVQLWELGIGESGFLEEYLFYQDETGNDGKENEFIQYCKGSRSIYIGSSKSPIRCKSELIGSEEIRDSKYNNYRIVLETKDKNLAGIMVVSKKPLPDRVKSLPISDDELERLKIAEEAAKEAFEKATKADFAKVPDKAFYKKELRRINNPTYLKYSSARYKILGQHGYIYISPIGPILGDPICWNIMNAVFREVEGRLKKIDDFGGCIDGFRDIDGDGVPEIFTKICDCQSEGTNYDYLSLTPTVRSVVSHSP